MPVQRAAPDHRDAHAAGNLGGSSSVIAIAARVPTAHPSRAPLLPRSCGWLSVSPLVRFPELRSPLLRPWPRTPWRPTMVLVLRQMHSSHRQDQAGPNLTSEGEVDSGSNGMQHPPAATPPLHHQRAQASARPALEAQTTTPWRASWLTSSQIITSLSQATGRRTDAVGKALCRSRTNQRWPRLAIVVDGPR
jgi:hypothetical protein